MSIITRGFGSTLVVTRGYGPADGVIVIPPLPPDVVDEILDEINTARPRGRSSSERRRQEITLRAYLCSINKERCTDPKKFAKTVELSEGTLGTQVLDMHVRRVEGDQIELTASVDSIVHKCPIKVTATFTEAQLRSPEDIIVKAHLEGANQKTILVNMRKNRDDDPED